MREQIEQLIVDIEAAQQLLRDKVLVYRQRHQYGQATTLSVVADLEQDVIDRLRAILSNSDASEAEKGSESSVGEG